LEMVAVASVLFTLLGVILGYYYVNREIHLHIPDVFKEGINFYKSGYLKIREHFQSKKTV